MYVQPSPKARTPHNPKTQTSYRANWKAGDEPCKQKLPFDLWALMKAEGSAQDPDAQYVRENCFEAKDVGVLELETPEV